jgi:hypothetical protein
MRLYSPSQRPVCWEPRGNEAVEWGGGLEGMSDGGTFPLGRSAKPPLH